MGETPGGAIPEDLQTSRYDGLARGAVKALRAGVAPALIEARLAWHRPEFDDPELPAARGAGGRGGNAARQPRRLTRCNTMRKLSPAPSSSQREGSGTGITLVVSN